ncbi:MAG: hypothetical protein LAO03_09635 [Acidobacteriia bacterium]|nr:hypothetical protein [Terriglobia bacterium]
MATGEAETIAKLLEALTGQRAPLSQGLDRISSFPKTGLGYSQLNELLLLFGYDRVTRTFFQFLADGTLDYKPGCAIRSIQEFETGVERARQLSLLFFGNVKFGFKKFARDADELRFYHASTQPVNEEMLKNRHDAIHPVDPIPLNETYYLGYVIQKELNDKLEKNPHDEVALAARKVLERVRDKGIRNQHAYLVSDHLDVYVATSMRRRHEYVEVAQFANQLFNHDLIKDLKLRWFDPTQAYCADRIDKGLAEALMLKRAKCTLYLAQESDTLGKDSELASTLAQGKPVIAYVPSPTEYEIVGSVKSLSALYSQSESSVILERLQALSPNLAWENPQLRQWLDAPEKVDSKRALELLVKTAQGHYARRAETLRESHPLGIQVNLDTGVANGVLVVRTLEDCAKLIHRIVTTTLQFSIERKSIGDVEYHLLRETVSNSIFRVMTGDAMLTNSFWNFYLEPSD